MRLNKYVLLALFTVVFATACDKDSPKNFIPPADGQNNPAPTPTPYEKSTRASRLGDEFSLNSSRGTFPESTGVLFFANHALSGTCTAWIAGELEGKSVVMTNKHCVEQVTDCSEQVAIRFPGTSEAGTCSRLLKVSEYDLGGSSGAKLSITPDYAILLMDRKFKSPPMKLSQDGLEYFAPVTLRKAWSQGYRVIDMQEENCQAGTANLLVKAYSTATAPNITLNACAVKGGVSGAPILNARGEVAALVQIGSKGGGMKLPSFPGLDASEFDIDSMAIGTNLSCVNFPALGLNPRANCAADIAGVQTTNKKAVDLLAKLGDEKSMLKAIAKEYARFLPADDSGIFGWTVRADDSQRVTPGPAGRGLMALEMTPKCILRPDEGESRLKEKYYKKGVVSYFDGYVSSADITVTTPGWFAGLKLDKYGQLLVKYTSGSKMAKYTFTPGEVAKLKDKETIQVTEWTRGKSIKLQLPLCKPGFRATDIKDSEELLKIVESGDDRALDAYIAAAVEEAKNDK